MAKQELTSHGIRVFYDDYEKDNLWGKDLYAHLTDVYQWQVQVLRTSLCPRITQPRFGPKTDLFPQNSGVRKRAQSGETGEYILPARFDRTAIPGLLHTVSYIDLSTTSPEQLTRSIVKKLGNEPRYNYLPPDLDRLYFRLNVVDDEIARSFVDSRAASFFGALSRMTPDERDALTSLIQSACAEREPDELHINADYLSRITGKSIPRLRGLLGGIGSLGFSCSFREGSHDGEDLPGEHLGQRYFFHLRWTDLSTHEQFTIEEFDEFNELFPEFIVATEMIDGATEGRCEDCGRQLLRRLDFSQLATATASKDAH